MSLQSWLENGWLRHHQTSKKEIADLFRIIERDLRMPKEVSRTIGVSALPTTQPRSILQGDKF